MTLKDLGIGAVAAIALAVGLMAYSKPTAEAPLGAFASPEVLDRVFFKDNVVIGGGVLATTSQGAATYTAGNIAQNKVILHIAPGALTATLPTKSALNAVNFIPNVGDTYTMFVYASTTLITLAGNTGVRLDSASTTNNISAAGAARLDFVRLPATEDRDIEVVMYQAE